MNRDETIALLMRCEQARVAARKAATEAQKENKEVNTSAHNAAKSVWNNWARTMLSERKLLEDAGKWKIRTSASGKIEALNTETAEWIKSASATFSSVQFNVTHYTFPWTTLFPALGTVIAAIGAIGTLATLFSEKLASPKAAVDNTPKSVFSPDKPDNSHPATEKSIQLSENSISFSEFIFPGPTYFEGAHFSGSVNLDEAHFKDCAIFDRAEFLDRAIFTKTHFNQLASFENAIFSGETIFKDVHYAHGCVFIKTQFKSATQFTNMIFSELACFNGARFFEKTTFVAQFNNKLSFTKAVFSKELSITDTVFHGVADFTDANFNGALSVKNVKYNDDVVFAKAIFSNDSSFESIEFFGKAQFIKCRFDRRASLLKLIFRGNADFTRAVFLTDTTFEDIRFMSEPVFKYMKLNGSSTFGQLHFNTFATFADVYFKEPPRIERSLLTHANLDNLIIGSPSLLTHIFKENNYELAARYRSYKMAAMEEGDSFSEHEFFTGELVGRVLSRYGRFSLVTFFAIFYELFSNFGRSLWRPIFWWLFVTFVAAALYLGENEDMIKQRNTLESQNIFGPIAYMQTTALAWRAGLPCFVPPKKAASEKLNTLGGLVPEARIKTTASSEALQLAFRTGFILLENGGNSAHRSYGCLYGIELYGESNPIPFVPSTVSIIQGVQKLFSAVFIFLFGLALRNMLKMK